MLRRLATGALQDSNEIDWPNIIEEIEAVGRSELRAVESLLFQALVQMLKAQAWPLVDTVPYWQSEARGFRLQARRIYTPSMAQRIDLSGIYADALRALPDQLGEQLPRPVPKEFPMPLQELLGV